MKHILILLATSTLISLNAHAGSFSEGWGGEASLAGSKTSGNTDTTDIGLALHLKKDSDAWKHSFDTTYDLGKSAGIDNKNRWYIGYQIDRKLSDRLYVYANTNYFTDDFGSYKQGSFIGGGLGYQVIKTDPMQWALEGGAGYRSQKLRESGFTPSQKESELAFRAKSDFDYKFNEAVSFYNDTEIVTASSDTYIWNDVGVTATLAGNLAARFSFRVDHHTDVPVGIKKTDTITRGAIVYTLK